MLNSMRVLAIDPGYDRVGIAIIEKSSPQSKEQLIHSECFSTDKELPLNVRTHSVGKHIEHIIKNYKPDCCALENLYFSKNQKTALQVAEARGVIIYEISNNNLELYEYPPSHIKIAVTGNGASSKEEIIKMIPLLISIENKKRLDDEYDAIALGITCIAHEYSRKKTLQKI